MKHDVKKLLQKNGLLRKNFDAIFADMDLFVAGIPDMASLIKVETFIEKMKFTAPQYYRRIENDDLWKRSELKRAKKIFQEHNIGTS